MDVCVFTCMHVCMTLRITIQPRSVGVLVEASRPDSRALLRGDVGRTEDVRDGDMEAIDP